MQPTFIYKTKNTARKIAIETWAGPGKFGVIIFISLIIVGVHENMFQNDLAMMVNTPSGSVVKRAPAPQGNVFDTFRNEMTIRHQKERMHQKIQESIETNDEDYSEQTISMLGQLAEEQVYNNGYIDIEEFEALEEQLLQQETVHTYKDLEYAFYNV